MESNNSNGNLKVYGMQTKLIIHKHEPIKLWSNIKQLLKLQNNHIQISGEHTKES